MEMYRPEDELGRHLLQTIPRKIFEWLVSNGLDADGLDAIGKIKWSSDLTGGVLEYGDIAISWSGHAIDPDSAMISKASLGDTSHNLKEFVEYEKSIYAEVEQFISNLPAKN